MNFLRRNLSNSREGEGLQNSRDGGDQKASDIPREDLLNLSMKLSKRLKASEAKLSAATEV